MYMNLDDEKKHFLVLMMGDFIDAMVPIQIQLNSHVLQVFSVCYYFS
jgi:hypothetical protein